MDWLDLLAVQATLKSFLQHCSSKASILQCSGFFTVQLLHLYMTTGKTIAVTRRTFVGKVTSLLFNMPSRCVSFSFKDQTSFNFMNFMGAVIVHRNFGAQENKVFHCFHCFPIYFHEVMLSFKTAFSCSSFTFIKRLFSSSLLSALRVVSSAYPRLFIFLPAILIPVCASSSPVLLMMYTAYQTSPS